MAARTLQVNMGNENLHPKIKAPQKWVSHTDGLRVQRTHWVLCQIFSPTISMKIAVMQVGTKSGRKKLHAYRILHIASLMMSASATCSASVVESVSHLCVLEKQQSYAPAHITDRPKPELLSVALLAKPASAYYEL